MMDILDTLLFNNDFEVSRCFIVQHDDGHFWHLLLLLLILIVLLITEGGSRRCWLSEPCLVVHRSKSCAVVCLEVDLRDLWLALILDYRNFVNQ